jgi:molybdopterin synthase catalytic subunit
MNNQQLIRHSALSATVSEIKAQTPRYFLNVGELILRSTFNLGNSALRTEDVLAWVRRATGAVTTYHGRFPVRRARVSVSQNDENDRSIHGTTRGDVDGFQGLSRMRLGRDVSRTDLEADWTMTHELVHLAIASLADEHHWLEEGLAT